MSSSTPQSSRSTDTEPTDQKVRKLTPLEAEITWDHIADLLPFMEVEKVSSLITALVEAMGVPQTAKAAIAVIQALHKHTVQTKAKHDWLDHLVITAAQELGVTRWSAICDSARDSFSPPSS